MRTRHFRLLSFEERQYWEILAPKLAEVDIDGIDLLEGFLKTFLFAYTKSMNLAKRHQQEQSIKPERLLRSSKKYVSFESSVQLDLLWSRSC